MESLAPGLPARRNLAASIAYAIQTELLESRLFQCDRSKGPARTLGSGVKVHSVGRSQSCIGNFFGLGPNDHAKKVAGMVQ